MTPDNYVVLFEDVLKDISNMSATLDNWQQGFQETNVVGKVNIAMLAGKMVDFIQTKLDKKCEKELPRFKEKLDWANGTAKNQ